MKSIIKIVIVSAITLVIVSQLAKRVGIVRSLVPFAPAA
jgi:hypothetical protein